MSHSKEDLLAYAELAEKAERYSDMLSYIKEIVKMGEGLTKSERDMLSVACKNTIGPKRGSSRCLLMLQQKHANDPLKLEAVNDLLERVIAEMTELCDSLLSDLEKYIFSRNLTPQEVVFYRKMIADYQRYLAEALSGEPRENAAKKAKEAYIKAYDVAIASLKASNSIRLGLMLNYSVFNYEIQNDIKSAIDIARAAIDGSLEETDASKSTAGGSVGVTQEEDGNKDCELIVQLLRDNLTLWQTEAPDSSSEDDESESSANPNVPE